MTKRSDTRWSLTKILLVIFGSLFILIGLVDLIFHGLPYAVHTLSTISSSSDSATISKAVTAPIASLIWILIGAWLIQSSLRKKAHTK